MNLAAHAAPVSDTGAIINLAMRKFDAYIAHSSKPKGRHLQAHTKLSFYLRP
ncbi:hypothetical protein [Azohydromonas caseinilytica]|uniref:Uncharacterized protein n=1 Tax=Azohydromonas caseinilytica TaxID=2728836 RepID=A0A848FKN5_9BURK|nr:hypothetical protein [Azohydromonas caseinilytica]NML18361.1 hypothetical protein [Azohydromonas caseinilytica]